MTKITSIYLDYEFFDIVEKNVSLVCCCTYDPIKSEKKKWWLLDRPDNQRRLREYLENYNQIIAYSAVAECRSFTSMGIDPFKKEWIDLFIEYRMLTNHNDKLQWGKQLVDGKVKTVRKPKPKWERTEEDKATGFKATHSLAEATYKLTGEIRDTAHKNKMRDIIISADVHSIYAHREEIMDYCLEDVVFLPKIWDAILDNFKDLVGGKIPLKQYRKEARERGRYSALTAEMESNGYPINLKATKNFSKQVGNIIYDVQREINHLFPDIKPFRWNKKEQRFTWDQKITKEWVQANHDIEKWVKTDSKAVSLSLDAWEKFYHFKHDYPTDNFGAQMVRFLKLKQSLYGFSSGGTSHRKTFWDSVGSDGMVRPYMNHFGAQSSRSQPGATGFMFLKPAWMRALVEPPPGEFMAGIDYGSEEFLISAIDAEDDAMIEAYKSGDPYLALGKMSGAIPPEGTKKTHGALRDMFKATTLGISYLMSKYGLANKLTADTGRVWTEDQAQELIDIFYSIYWKLEDRQKEIQERYLAGEYIRLADGWTLWPDNDNFRSVVNMPIQGAGAVIMRRAALMARERGVHIVFTLHDALYMKDKIGNEHKILILRDCMRKAFMSVFPPERQEQAKMIRLDPKAWSPDYEEKGVMEVGKSKWKVPFSRIHIDERALSDYNKFSVYFTDRLEDRF